MPLIRRKLFWCLDLLGMLAAFMAAGWWIAPMLRAQLSFGGALYGNWVQHLSPAESFNEFTPLSQFAWVFAFVSPTTILFMDLLGGHRPISQQSVPKIIAVTALAPLTGVSLLATVFFVLRTPAYSRTFVVSFAVASWVSICSLRLIGRKWYQYTLSEGVHAQGIAVIGRPSAVAKVCQELRSNVSSLGSRVVGYLSLPLTGEEGGETYECDIPFLGEVSVLEKVLVHQAIGAVILILPSGELEWLECAIKSCDYLRVTTHIVPEMLLGCQLDDLVAETGGLPGHIPALTLAPVESHSEWLFVKRLTDVLVSATGLILLTPVFVLIGAAIKLTTPNLAVFYHWHVVGLRGRRFTGYKFTTMVADADARKASLAVRNEMSGPVFKIANDPRVTPLGRFLRKYSLNELPQLWSVLKGDMSLVGPRPAGPHELKSYEPWHKRKLSAQPGMTCLWQVMGRNRISNFDEWVKLDLEYIRRRSFWVDCKILARTAWVVVRGTGS